MHHHHHLNLLRRCRVGRLQLRFLSASSGGSGDRIDTRVDAAALASAKRLPSAWLAQPRLNADWQVVRREHFAVRACRL